MRFAAAGASQTPHVAYSHIWLEGCASVQHLKGSVLSTAWKRTVWSQMRTSEDRGNMQLLNICREAWFVLFKAQILTRVSQWTCRRGWNCLDSPVGCLLVLKTWMSMGEKMLEWTTRWPPPVCFLHEWMEWVVQSVQKSVSSNRVRANGWGSSPLTTTSLKTHSMLRFWKNSSPSFKNPKGGAAYTWRSRPGWSGGWSCAWRRPSTVSAGCSPASTRWASRSPYRWSWSDLSRPCPPAQSLGSRPNQSSTWSWRHRKTTITKTRNTNHSTLNSVPTHWETSEIHTCTSSFSTNYCRTSTALSCAVKDGFLHTAT